MTQPTQQLPPYLSASTFITSTSGSVVTVTTLVKIPITYYGPSIPLGTDGVWTFGGSTSPPPSSMTTFSTATPPTTFSTSIIPTATSISTSSSSLSTIASSSILSSSSIPPTVTSLSSSASFSSPSTAPSSSFSSSAFPFPTPTESSSQRVRRALPGIIIGVLVFLLLILTALAVLCFRRYRRRRSILGYGHPNLSDFVLVDAEGGTRVAGEGVARPSGGEEDSFLSRSLDAADAMSERDPTTRLVSIPEVHKNDNSPDRPSGGEGIALADASPGRASPGTHTMSSTPIQKTKLFSGSVTSLFFNPYRGSDPAIVVAPDRTESAEIPRDSSSTQPSSGPSYVRGPIIPPRQLLEMDDEWQREAEAAERLARANVTPDVAFDPSRTPYAIPDSPLRPPPVLNPDGLPSATRHNSWRQSANTQFSVHSDIPLSDPELDENATLLTARRVVMNEGGPSTMYNVDPASAPSSWGSGLGLGGLTRLSRLSWFQRMDASRSRVDVARSRSPTRSRSPPAQGRMLTDREIQAGRALLGAAALSQSSLGAPAVVGQRPISQVSVQSRLSAVSSGGNTVYHDAMSSMSSRSRPGTPLRRVATRTPPPEMPKLDLPIPRVPSPPRAAVSVPTPDVDNPSGVNIDILDLPAPPPMSPFSSTSSRGGPALPPGLEHLATTQSWRESSSDMPSAASFGSGGSAAAALMVGGQDILEQAPPAAGEGWTHLRAVTGGGIDSGRRTTLGQPIYIHRDGTYSERGSLHSMPTNLSPLAPTAAGSHSHSRPPSRLTQYGSSNGSGSSRPSLHSQAVSGGSSGGSLEHSNSISSDGRRRRRREPGEPTSSQPLRFDRASLSAMGSLSPLGTPQRSPTAYNATFNSSLTGGTRTTSGTTDLSSSVASGTTQTTADPFTGTGGMMHFPDVHLV